MFPGRRLDQRNKSTYSGYSGRSLDIETIISGGAGGRLNSADTVTSNNLNNGRPLMNGTAFGLGSAKPGSGSIQGQGFSRSLNDVTNQSWDAIRQPIKSAQSNGNLSLFNRPGSKPFSGVASQLRGIANKFAGASASMGNLATSSQENVANGFPVPSKRWQFSSNNRLNQTEFPFNKTIRDSTSPDSSYSSESTSDPEWPGARITAPAVHGAMTLTFPGSRARQPRPSHNRSRLQQHMQYQQERQQQKQHLQKREELQQERNRSKTPIRKPSDNTSSTPQLDKILWALGNTIVLRI